MYDRLKFQTLSSREKEIFYRVAIGKTNKEIAKECFVSIETVKSHIQNIYKKLSIEHRTQLVIYAFVTKQISWNEKEGRLLCQEK